MTTETDEFSTDEEFDEDAIDEDDDLDLSDSVLEGAPEDDEDDDGDDDDGDDDDDESAEALDELEAEELEMLTEDESVETIVVDEAAEMRAIRRAEIAMEGEAADGAHSDEFVCTSCFLVKSTIQLANKRKKVCKDCAG